MSITRLPNGIAFSVSDVTPETELRPRASYAEVLAVTLGHDDVSELEAYSRDTKPLTYPRPETVEAPVHAVIYAATVAYDRHYPLTLSPDSMWLMIAQGFALHVAVNAEAMRSRFVAHEGKAEIVVIRDEFVRGFAGNDWEGVFGEFAAQIQACVGTDKHDLVVKEFSTTGIVERAAFQVTLMDAMQHYYDYTLMSRCGIPSITLEGTPENWTVVRAGVEAMARYDLDWWTSHALPVLDEFVRASRGIINRPFWEDIYKVSFSSGGPYINGHLVNLFPYLTKQPLSPKIQARLQQRAQESGTAVPSYASQDTDGSPFRNPYLGRNTSDKPPSLHEGMTTRQLPPALSVTPFTWNHLGQKLPMEFVAGFVGVAQDENTLALRPEIGWAVRKKQA